MNKFKELSDKLNKISEMTEAINLDASLRKNLKDDNPNLYFIREDIELTIMREDMLLEKLEDIEREYLSVGEEDERIENKIKLNRQSILRLKSSDLNLLTYMDANIKANLSIAKMLKEVNDE